MDFNTTRAENGNLTTSTPGHSGSAGDDFSQIIGQILQKRQPQQQGFQRQTARAPQQQQTYQSPMYAPQMGAQQSAPVQPKQAPVTRTRRVRKRTVLPAIFDQAGNTYDDMTETQLPDGSWSLDAVHGTLANQEEMARAHQQEVYKTGGGVSSAPALDPRMMALRAQQSQNTSQYNLTPQQSGKK